MDSEGLIKKDPLQRPRGIAALEQNSPEYQPVKSKESMRQEREARHDLKMQGVNEEIIKAIRGYRPNEIPFVYRDAQHEVFTQEMDGVSHVGYKKALSELWLGSTDEIWNLQNEQGWRDQIPEVVVQWRGQQKEGGEGKKRVTRLEVHHISDEAFIQLEYRQVTEMGQFDGELSGISLYTLKETFRPYGGNERNSYDITYITRKREVDTEGLPGGRKVIERSEPKWQMSGGLSGHVTGTSMLNGLGELLWLDHITSIQSVKWIPEKSYRFSELPEPNKREMASLPPSKVALVELQNSLEPQEDLGVLLNDAQEIMTRLFSDIKERINSEGFQKGAVEMELDGILNHPEKIWVLDKYLDEVDHKTRFAFGIALADTLRTGKLSEWVDSVFLKSEALQDDLIIRNARHLVLWLKRSDFSYTEIKDTLSKAKRDLIESKVDPNDYKTNDILRYSKEGLGSSLVERYVEYMAQKYLGNYLNPNE